MHSQMKYKLFYRLPPPPLKQMKYISIFKEQETVELQSSHWSSNSTELIELLGIQEQTWYHAESPSR